MKIKVCLLLGILALFSTSIYAQYSDFKYKRKNHSTEAGYAKAVKQSKYLSGGLGVSLNSYFGDLTPNQKYLKNSFKTVRPGLTAFGSYNYNGHLFFSADLLYQRIIGDDFNSETNHSSISARKYIRNLSFRNDMFGINLRANANLFGDPYEYYMRSDYNVYFFTGISVIYSNPKSKTPEQSRDGVPFDNAGEWIALRELGTEGQNHSSTQDIYSSVQFGIPVGLGFRYKLNHKIDLFAEVALSYILSDYIDDVGGNFVDLGIFEDELAKALSDRSAEEMAMLKNEMRDMEFVLQSTDEYTYESIHDGNSYTVFDGFGHEGAPRGGDKNDIITSLSFKISYIFTK